RLVCLVLKFVSCQKFQANAEGNSDELVDPPKVEDNIGAVPHGLSTDSEVVKRWSGTDIRGVSRG
ncbi:endoplasmin, partial [Trifolium pratense]